MFWVVLQIAMDIVDCFAGSLLKGHSEFSDSPILCMLPVFLVHLWVCALGLGIYLHQFGLIASSQGLLASIRLLASIGSFASIGFICGFRGCGFRRLVYLIVWGSWVSSIGVLMGFG